MFVKHENEAVVIITFSCTGKLYVEVDFSSEEA